MVEIGGGKKLKKEEILIDKYYSYVKIIHKVVLDIPWYIGYPGSSVGKSLLVNSILEDVYF